MCGRWRKRVKWARETGIWKPSPEHRGENGQVRTDTKELLERPKHLSEERRRNSRRARTAASKEPSNRAENSASLGANEQCLRLHL